jgi:hypothetical protein
VPVGIASREIVGVVMRLLVTMVEETTIILAGMLALASIWPWGHADLV